MLHRLCQSHVSWRPNSNPKANIRPPMCAGAQSSPKYRRMIEPGVCSSSLPWMNTRSTRPGDGDGDLLPGFFWLPRRTSWTARREIHCSTTPTGCHCHRGPANTARQPVAHAHRMSTGAHARQSAMARAQTLSTVKPYSRNMTPPGADAPKRSTARTSPRSPA